MSLLLAVDNVVLLDIGVKVLLCEVTALSLGDDIELGVRRVEATFRRKLHRSQVQVGLEGQSSPRKHVIILQIGVHALIIKGVWGLPRILAPQEGPPLTFDQSGTGGGVHRGKHQGRGL